MPEFTGSCPCNRLSFTLTLSNPAEDARTSVCHCGNCKKFTGGAFGVTTKVPRSSFKYVSGAGREGTNCRGGEGEGEGGSGKTGGDRGKEGGGGDGEVVVRVHEADNGGGVVIRREFCGSCGGPILEYGVRIVSHSASLMQLLLCIDASRVSPFGCIGKVFWVLISTE
jgi:hypothetical protein